MSPSSLELAHPAPATSPPKGTVLPHGWVKIQGLGSSMFFFFCVPFP